MQPGTMLFDFLVLLLIVGNLFALVVGVLMMLAPERLWSWSGLGDTWVSTRKLLKPLELPHVIDAVLLKYPRVLGALFLGAGLLILIQAGTLARKLSAAEGGRLLAQFFGLSVHPTGAWETLWLSMLGLILLGAAMAVVVGAVALIQSKLLHQWSAAANRWISTRRAMEPLERPRYGFDQSVRTRPRLWGGLIAAIALYAIIVLAWLIRSG